MKNIWRNINRKIILLKYKKCKNYDFFKNKIYIDSNFFNYKDKKSKIKNKAKQKLYKTKQNKQKIEPEVSFFDYQINAIFILF